MKFNMKLVSITLYIAWNSD